MKIRSQIRTELLKAYPTSENEVGAYIRFLESAPTPSRENKFHEHHMLPQLQFSQYSDLRVDRWSGCALSIQDHGRAHQLLNKIMHRKRKFLTSVRLNPSKYSALKVLAAKTDRTVSKFVAASKRSQEKNSK